LARLDNLTADLTATREKVDGLTKNSTVEEIRTVIKEVKETWKEIRKEERRIVALLAHAKLGEVVEKHEGLVQSMQARIDNLAKQGADTTELETIKAEFETLLAKIREDYNTAKEEWQAAEDKKAALDAWKDVQQNVRDGMKEARELLRDFTRKFVELKQGLAEEKKDAKEAEEEEDEEESENENDDGPTSPFFCSSSATR